jgi:hypothetical protein
MKGNFRNPNALKNVIIKDRWMWVNVFLFLYVLIQCLISFKSKINKFYHRINYKHKKRFYALIIFKNAFTLLII